ncbi:unnamed protein product [Cylicocyclus nassatus]|uniref:Uncharacterized protein n=1 Tax=Cylicocyclus nassatus TaxID=53992 RepID=A0AA36H3V6_CYLNA|nr:unnamed protein product [Cylicocyclus nassatus]
MGVASQTVTMRMGGVLPIDLSCDWLSVILEEKVENIHLGETTAKLCPAGLQPLTGVRHVRTCEDECPYGSTCIKGICCMRQPSCNHFTYKHPSQYSCLPRVKQNCPDGYKCVPSTQDGMHICCSSKPPRVARVPPEQTVCPASHPVISNDRHHLRLCSECQNGVCTPFRSSDISVCCHSSSAFCGPGSSVELDGLLARDCSKFPCSEGYECSLAPSGSRVCCSLADCSNGQRARAVCAAGCRRDEKCEVILGQRWCCPTVPSRCPDGRKSGSSCSPIASTCDEGYECMENEKRDDYICCQISSSKKDFMSLIKAVKLSKRPLPTSAFTTYAPLVETTTTFPSSGQRLRCGEDVLPLLIDGEYLRCPQLGAPCPRAGYTCQVGIGGLFCCPLDVEVVEVEEETNVEKETTTISSPSITGRKTEISCRGCLEKVTTTTEQPIPKCPFAFREARAETTDEIRKCVGFLDFSCPFGYTCLPSSTTPSFLCCAQNTTALL